MPTQEENLDQAKVDELKAFAQEKEVDLGDATTKDEIKEKLVAARKVSAAEIEERFGPDSSDTAPAPGTGTASTATATRVTRTPEAILDPALVDPEGATAARAGGRTSDPANRAEDVRAADVPADLSEGAKPSDAGAEDYPFPPGGDVEVSMVGTGENKGEYSAPLNVEDWVVLDGKHELVPDRLDGHIAYVIEAPSEPAPDVWDHPNAARVPVEDAGITVRTRDEVNATLVLPMAAFKAVGRGGRSTLLPIG